jgi:hypothetical protein
VPLGATLIALTLLFFAYQLTPVRAAAALPIALCLICAGTALRALHRDPTTMWDPLVWFLTACSVYYGLGPLIFIFGDEAIVSYIKSYNFVDETAILRTNVLNVVSIIGVCAVYRLWMVADRFGRPFVQDAWNERDNGGALLALIVGVGWASHVAIMVLRATRGEDAVMFGILFSLAELSKIGVAMAFYRFASRNSKALAPLILIMVVELYFAVGTLMKQEVLEVLLLAFLGWFLASPSKRVVASAMALATLAYFVMVPVFGAARNVAWAENPNSPSAGVTGARNALGDAIADLSESTGQHWWWSRLSQSSAQSFAMDAYDSGQPGRTLAVALATPIPRVIWPDKPIVNYGSVFTTLVNGDASSGDTGPGFFAEAYWNLGWLGVLIVAAVTGTAYAWFARRNVAALRAADLRWLPLAYWSLKMGYRPDDWFVATIIGPLPIMVAIWVLISQSMSVLTSKPSVVTARPVRL